MHRAAPDRITLVAATSNRGKLEELKALLAGLLVEVRALGEVVANPPSVVEDGVTFADNAIKKARTAAIATGMLALADDSGLEVDALDGRPGVRSARFAGDEATDAENITALLIALDDSCRAPPFHARFRCVLALADPRGSGGAELWTFHGACEGVISRAPRGTGGFGYDPVFVVAGTERTMAELDPKEKNRVSHRARAFVALRAQLVRRLIVQPAG